MIVNNVKLVLDDRVVQGSLEMQDGVIRSFTDGPSRLPQALDGDGGWLLPGLIELHTDNTDKFFTPRPNVDWPAHSAMSSHDALMVANGITTVLDAVAIGDVRDGGHRLENLQKMIDAVIHSQRAGVNRAEHRLHLRCELPHESTLPLFEQLMDKPGVSLVSLMDHSPGQRQFASREKYREYYQGKYHLNDQQMSEYEEQQVALSARWAAPNREAIAAHCRARRISLASHDDATAAHVAESCALGSAIAEFPHRGGRPRLAPAGPAGADGRAEHRARRFPLRQRGGAPPAALGVLDILSSDYYPASLLDAAFRLAADERNAYDLPGRCA